MKGIFRYQFDRIVARHDGDKYSKGLRFSHWAWREKQIVTGLPGKAWNVFFFYGYAYSHDKSNTPGTFGTRRAVSGYC